MCQVWYNEVGNREIYMNCARVTIQSSTAGRHRRALATRQNSMDSLPNMFVCNIGNGCTTIEEEDVIFPSPGSNVVSGTDAFQTQGGVGYSTSGVASATATGGSLSATGSAVATTMPTIAQVPSSSTTAFAGGSASTAASYSSTSQQTSSAIASSTSFATMTSSAAPASTSLSGPCTVGSFACNSATTFSQCVPDGDGSTSYTYMGSVAAGMQCVNGSFTQQNSGSCSPNGALVCDPSGGSFYMCDNGGLISMGAVAPGTECVDGEIVAASSESKC